MNFDQMSDWLRFNMIHYYQCEICLTMRDDTIMSMFLVANIAIKRVYIETLVYFPLILNRKPKMCSICSNVSIPLNTNCLRCQRNCKWYGVRPTRWFWIAPVHKYISFSDMMKFGVLLYYLIFNWLNHYDINQSGLKMILTVKWINISAVGPEQKICLRKY